VIDAEFDRVEELRADVFDRAVVFHAVGRFSDDEIELSRRRLGIAEDRRVVSPDVGGEEQAVGRVLFAPLQHDIG
jgi:hypothetical protein